MWADDNGRAGFAKLLKTAAERASVDNDANACGHALAMKGRDTRLIQDWLGHRNIQHTSHYTVVTASVRGDLGLDAPTQRARVSTHTKP